MKRVYVAKRFMVKVNKSRVVHNATNLGRTLDNENIRVEVDSTVLLQRF